MKIITILITTLIMNGCGSSKEAAANDSEVSSSVNTENNTDIAILDQDKSFSLVYSASSRGGSKEVKVQDHKLLVQKARGVAAEDVSCSKEEWSKMISLMNDVNLKTLPELESSSKAHQYDGALAATLTITKNGKTYQTKTFDHGKPPKEIEALVTYVLSLSKID